MEMNIKVLQKKIVPQNDGPTRHEKKRNSPSKKSRPREKR